MFGFVIAHAQNGQAPQTSPDPIAIGKQAIAREQWEEAERFFKSYLRENPDSAEGQYNLGFAYFGEKQYAKAEQVYMKMIVANPKSWAAHSSLAEVCAAEGRWPDFNQERKLVRDARERGEAGASRSNSDVIDVLYVGAERYIVREFNPLNGRFHSRYSFTHFGKDGKLDFWIQCESDDVDQSSFAQKHPKEAAAGQRSFSLDSYSQTLNASGQLVGQTHGTIKFYWDGEPTYETVRADVLGALERKATPMSTTTVPAPTANPSAKP